MLFGVIMGLAASASWAAANVFVARSSRAAGPFRALVWAQVVGGLALAPIALLFEQPSGVIDGGIVGWAAIAGVAAVLAYVCLFYSLEHGQLAVVVPIMSSWSAIAAGLSIAVLGETLRRTHLVGAALVVIGVLMVSRFSQSDGAASTESKRKGDGEGESRGSAQGKSSTRPAGRRGPSTLLAAIGGAVGFGVLIPAIDRLAPVVGRLGAIPVVFFLELVLAIPLALVARVDISLPPRGTWFVIAAAGLFETAGFVWISLGTSRAPVAVVSPLAGLAPAFTVLFAWVVLRERPAAPILAGAAIACAGVVTLAL